MEGLDSNNIAGILLMVKDEVLVLYKHNSEIDIPKGHIQLSETPLEGIQRELNEEAGIVLHTEPQYLGKIQVKSSKKLYMYAYQTNQIVDVKVSSEHSGYDFIPINEVTSDFFWSPVQYFFNKLMEKKDEIA